MALNVRRDHKRGTLQLVKGLAKPDTAVTILEGDIQRPPPEAAKDHDLPDETKSVGRRPNGATLASYMYAGILDQISEKTSEKTVEHGEDSETKATTPSRRPQTLHIPLRLSERTGMSTKTSSGVRQLERTQLKAKYILLCVNQGTQIQLRQVKIHPLWNDEALFQMLHNAYQEVRKSHKLGNWLVGPQTMRYVKVRSFVAFKLSHLS